MQSYSIIVETENLSAAEAGRLWDSLASIEVSFNRYHPPERVLVFDTGKAPQSLLEKIHERFEWLEVAGMPEGTGYYDSKMHGARAVNSEIIVLADSDCVYNRDWLENLLKPFEDPAVSVVAGETTMQGSGPYALAMAVVHAFDGYSGNRKPHINNDYYANNVAFRRSLLIDIPIPEYTAAYRNTCYVHSIELRRNGIDILGQPESRAWHANPENFYQFVLRYWFSGCDKGIRRRCEIIDDAPKHPVAYKSKFGMYAMRIRRSLSNHPRQWIYLPVAIPIAGFALALEAVGMLYAYLLPDSAIRMLTKSDQVERPTVAEVKANHQLHLNKQKGHGGRQA